MFDKKLLQKYDEEIKRLIKKNVELMVERDRLRELVNKYYGDDKNDKGRTRRSN